jgi:hypothetical protein
MHGFPVLLVLICVLFTVACEPITSVSSFSENNSSEGGELPELGNGDTNSRIAALESYLTQMQSQNTNRLNQCLEENENLKQQVANYATQTANALGTVNSQTQQITAAVTTVSTTLPNQICTGLGGIWTENNVCNTTPSTRVIVNESNGFICVPGAPDCNVTPVSGTLPNISTDLINPTAYGTAVCQNYSCGIRQFQDFLFRRFTISQALGCRVIKVQLSLSGQSLRNSPDHMFLTIAMLQNNGPLRFHHYSGGAGPVGERPISWAPGGVQNLRILESTNSNEISIYNRGGQDNSSSFQNNQHSDRNKFKQRTIYLDPSPGGDTELSFRGSYSMFAPTDFKVTIECLK